MAAPASTRWQGRSKAALSVAFASAVLAAVFSTTAAAWGGPVVLSGTSTFCALVSALATLWVWLRPAVVVFPDEMRQPITGLRSTLASKCATVEREALLPAAVLSHWCGPASSLETDEGVLRFVDSVIDEVRRLQAFVPTPMRSDVAGPPQPAEWGSVDWGEPREARRRSSDSEVVQQWPSSGPTPGQPRSLNSGTPPFQPTNESPPPSPGPLSNSTTPQPPPYWLQRRQVSVLQCNVRGFLNVCQALENQGAATVLCYLGITMGCVNDAVKRYRGSVDAMFGDRATASFNSFFPSANHCSDAVLCACWVNESIKRETVDLRRVAEESAASSGRIFLWPTEAASVGVVTGTSLVGVVGCSEIKRLGCIGRLVTWAASVERLSCYWGPVLTDAVTQSTAGSCCQWKLMPAEVVCPKKGTQDPCKLWQAVPTAEWMWREWQEQSKVSNRAGGWDAFNVATASFLRGDFLGARSASSTPQAAVAAQSDNEISAAFSALVSAAMHLERQGAPPEPVMCSDHVPVNITGMAQFKCDVPQGLRRISSAPTAESRSSFTRVSTAASGFGSFNRLSPKGSLRSMFRQADDGGEHRSVILSADQDQSNPLPHSLPLSLALALPLTTEHSGISGISAVHSQQSRRGIVQRSVTFTPRRGEGLAVPIPPRLKSPSPSPRSGLRGWFSPRVSMTSDLRSVSELPALQDTNTTIPREMHRIPGLGAARESNASGGEGESAVVSGGLESEVGAHDSGGDLENRPLTPLHQGRPAPGLLLFGTKQQSSVPSEHETHSIPASRMRSVVSNTVGSVGDDDDSSHSNSTRMSPTARIGNVLARGFGEPAARARRLRPCASEADMVGILARTKAEKPQDVALYGIGLSQVPDWLPDTLARTTTSLDLSRNVLESVPAALSKLVSLKTLDLSSNHLISLPEDLGSMPSLTMLIVSHNRLTALPRSLGSSPSCLEEINCAWNRLWTFPVHVLKIASLRHLDVAENQAVVELPNKMEFDTVTEPLSIKIDNDPALTAQASALLAVTSRVRFVWNPVFPDRVRPWGLYIGALRTAQERVYARLGITHVLTVGRELDVIPAPHVAHHKVNVDDIADEDIITLLASAHNFIDQGRLQSGKVLVHCFKGQSRSATVTASYLMKTEGLCVEDALQSVREARPCIRPNDGFLAQMHRLELTWGLHNTRSVVDDDGETQPQLPD
eukprot:TRINITY_DN14624_c0_g1_i1.p1 TRINITY_DN14624_c0_g1~~TRINITY_DN14624_c0_g1_i1.p1  ORF type:complete len:1215 (+),score=237.77 TRINITY_DN14624_c0_g1_i1:61-3645(+)